LPPDSAHVDESSRFTTFTLPECSASCSQLLLLRLFSAGAEICDIVFASAGDSCCLALALVCSSARDSMQIVLSRRAAQHAKIRLQLQYENARMALVHEAFSHVIRTCAASDTAFLSPRDTVALGTSSVQMHKLVRLHKKRQEISLRKERVRELSLWRNSLVDWCVRYVSPEADQPLVDFGWIDFYDCISGSFYITWDTAPLKREWTTLPCAGNQHANSVLSTFETSVCDCARISSDDTPNNACRFHGINLDWRVSESPVWTLTSQRAPRGKTRRATQNTR